MEVIAMEELLERSDYSIYRLVRMAAKRATEISDGRPSLVGHSLIEKPTTTALREIAAGKVETKAAAEKHQPKAK
jgi:DNA-directed RNA polymerase omega subunit